MYLCTYVCKVLVRQQCKHVYIRLDTGILAAFGYLTMVTYLKR